MIQNKHLPIASYLIMLLALILGTPQDNDFIIGDFLLSKLGFILWSNGTEGLHYSGIIALIMVAVAVIGFAFCTDEFSSKVKKLAIITFLFGHLLFRPMFNETYGFIKGSMSGLDSVGYLSKTSHSSLKSTPDDKLIKIESNLTFENYSSEEKRFYIKLIPDDYHITDDKQMVAKDEQTKLDQEFSLAPESKRTVYAVFFAKPQEGVSGASGSFQDADIVIFNSTDETEFIRGHY